MNKKRLILGLVVILIGGWLAFKPASNETQSDKPVIKIGVPLPLTGNVAHNGILTKKGMEMALGDLPKDTKYRYELVFEDTALDTKKTALVTQKMLNIDKVDIMTFFWDVELSVISPIIRQKEMLALGCAWGSKAVKENPYVFNHYTPLEEEVRVLIEGFKKHNIKRIGVLQNMYAGGSEIIDILFSQLKKTDIKVIYHERSPSGKRDFRQMITNLKKYDVDALFSTLFSPEIEIFMRQRKQLDFKTPVAAIDTFYEVETPEIFNDLWYASGAVGTKEFIERFEKESGKPINNCVANMYDIVRLTVQAYENAPTKPGQKPTTEAVKAELHKIKNYQGATGPLWIDQHGKVQTKAYLAIIKDGKPVRLED